MDDDQIPEAAQEAETAYNGMGATGLLTREPHPAPDLYGILGA